MGINKKIFHKNTKTISKMDKKSEIQQNLFEQLYDMFKIGAASKEEYELMKSSTNSGKRSDNDKKN